MKPAERQIPHDLEAEAAVLGALMVDVESMWRVADLLRPEDFYHEPNRILFDIASDVAMNGSGPLDAVRLTRAVDDRRLRQRVGGAAYVQSLIDRMPDVGNVEHYANIVAELSRRRRLLTAAQRAAAALSNGSTFDDVTGPLLGDLMVLTTRRGNDGGDLGKLAREAAGTTLEIHRNGVGVLGSLTGLAGVDELLQGLKTGMYVLAARPGAGKSTLADQIAVHVARTTERPVLILVTEMSPHQRAARQVSAETGIPLPRLHSGRLTVDERERLERIARCETSFPRVRVESAVGRTAGQVRLRVRQFAAAEGSPALVVVDYLQQLRAVNPRADLNQRTGEKSNQMAELAQEISAPVLVCSQLSRSNEKERRPPRLSDLRESGEIEQDAYAVAFLHHPDADDRERTVFLLEKHKDGPIGLCPLRFRPAYMRFESVNGGGVCP